MKIALIGLGKMGGNMARRLLRAGHQVVGYNLIPEVTQQLAQEEGLNPANDLQGIIQQLEPPRAIWVMVPAGTATEEVINSLGDLLSEGDIVIDGGNSNFNDSIRRGTALWQKKIYFLDVGVSGGVWGLKEGYSLMVGGDHAAADLLRPIFESLAPAPDQGWGYVGPLGAGHYVKMIHNGIEYGMMEALAEGFELLKAREDLNLDLHQVAEIWRTGSVVRSWLLDLIALSLKGDPDLKDIRDWVADSGEGRWTVMEAIHNAVPAPVIALSLFRRFESRQDSSYSGKLLAAMRSQFGGHDIKKE